MTQHPDWISLHPRTTIEMLGFIPSFLDLNDPRNAREQLHSNYLHGGGWRPFEGFEFDLSKPPSEWALQYAGDPPYPALAMTRLREERVVVFNCAWVAIIQPSDEFEIARMD